MFNFSFLFYHILDYWNADTSTFQIISPLQEQWLMKFQFKLESNTLNGNPKAILKLGGFLTFRAKCGPTTYTLDVKTLNKLFENLSTLPTDRYVQLAASLVFDPLLNKHVFEVRVDGMLVLSTDELSAVVRNDVNVAGGTCKSRLKNIVIKNL